MGRRSWFTFDVDELQPEVTIALTIKLILLVLRLNRRLVGSFLVLCRANLVALTWLGGGYRRSPNLPVEWIERVVSPPREPSRVVRCSVNCPQFYTRIDCCTGPVVTGIP